MPKSISLGFENDCRKLLFVRTGVIYVESLFMLKE